MVGEKEEICATDVMGLKEDDAQSVNDVVVEEVGVMEAASKGESTGESTEKLDRSLVGRSKDERR